MGTGEKLKEILLHWLYEEIVPDLTEEITRQVLAKIETNDLKSKKVTRTELCEILNLSSSTVERMIRGGLKFEQNVKKGKRLFTIDDVEKYKKRKR